MLGITGANLFANRSFLCTASKLLSRVCREGIWLGPVVFYTKLVLMNLFVLPMLFWIVFWFWDCWYVF